MDFKSVPAFFFLLVVSFSVRLTTGSGFFELDIVEIQNPDGRLANGDCCANVPPVSSARRWNSSPTFCSRECSTYFRLCLKEYQSNVTVFSPCSYGNGSGPVLGGNSFLFHEPQQFNARFVLPFTFRWTKSFTLILEALDSDNSTAPEHHRDIVRAVYSGLLDPSEDWHSVTQTTPYARLTYRVRVQCDANYYGATCATFCRSRDDKFGHWTCSPDGIKQCLQGWSGPNCDIAICKEGCHPVNGRCDKPGECICRTGNGFTGPLCDQCMTYPGCKHGYCNGAPWQCICETNWGGLLCDQDLNYCGTHQPCQNGGTCQNPAPDSYSCVCPEGFSGTNCEVPDNACALGPCQHAGTCYLNPAGGFNCSCAPGWTGPTCADNIDECASAPCMNGATCVDLENGFTCSCPPGFQGTHCEQDIDECTSSSPCKNAVECINLPGAYNCTCLAGWTGQDCEINTNDCQDQCLNGGTCVDLVNQFHCVCPPGFTGFLCEENIDECQLVKDPCRNGGNCVDLIDGYKCICPLGYTGTHCEVDNDLCHPNPCLNGAPCVNTDGDFFCHCPSRWQGKNCSQEKDKETYERSAHRDCDGSRISSWDDDCNHCTCHEGTAHCTRVWCGQRNCLSDPRAFCGSAEVCVPLPSQSCLSPPCEPQGECRYLGRQYGLFFARTCLPNGVRLSPWCSSLDVHIRRQMMVPGSTVEGFCQTLRKLAARLSPLWEDGTNPGLRDPLIIMCDVKEGSNDVIQVALESTETNRATLVAHALIEALKSGKTNDSTLEAVTGIELTRLEINQTNIPSDKTTLIVSISCSVIGSVLLISTVALLACRYRYQRKLADTHSASRDIEQASNNNKVEEPAKDTDDTDSTRSKFCQTPDPDPGPLKPEFTCDPDDPMYKYSIVDARNISNCIQTKDVNLKAAFPLQRTSNIPV